MKYLFWAIVCLTLLMPVLFAARPAAAQSIAFEVVYDPTNSGQGGMCSPAGSMTFEEAIDNPNMGVEASAEGDEPTPPGYHGSCSAYGTYDFTVTWSGVTLNHAYVSVGGELTAQSDVPAGGGASSESTIDTTLLTCQAAGTSSHTVQVPSGTEIVVDCGGVSSGSAYAAVELTCVAGAQSPGSNSASATANLYYTTITYD